MTDQSDTVWRASVTAAQQDVKRAQAAFTEANDEREARRKELADATRRLWSVLDNSSPQLPFGGPS